MSESAFLVPIPLYVRLHRQTPVIRSWPPLLVALAGLLLVVGGWELVHAVGLHQRTAVEALCLYGVAAIAAVGFVLLNWACREARKAAGAIRRILSTDSQLKRLGRHLESMFGRRIQDRFALGGVAVLVTAVLLMDPGLSLVPYGLFLLLAVVGAGILGYGFGLAVMTMIWIHSLPKYGAMKLFVLPSYTPALRVVSRLTGFFALLFVIESLASIGLFVTVPWKHAVIVDVVAALVAAPVVFLGVALCFYPQFAIRKIVVKRRRILVARFVQLTQSRGSVVDEGACDSLVQSADLCARIESSPSYALDFGTLARFAASAIIVVWATLNFAVGEEGVRQGFWDLVRDLASAVGL